MHTPTIGRRNGEDVNADYLLQMVFWSRFWHKVSPRSLTRIMLNFDLWHSLASASERRPECDLLNATPLCARVNRPRREQHALVRNAFFEILAAARMRPFDFIAARIFSTRRFASAPARSDTVRARSPSFRLHNFGTKIVRDSAGAAVSISIDHREPCI